VRKSKLLRSQLLWKTYRNLLCEVFVCSHHRQRSETSGATRDAPSKCFCTSDTTKLCCWLCMFVKEARCDDAQLYTPRSLTQLLSGIQSFSSSKIYTTPESAYTPPEVIYVDSGVIYTIYNIPTCSSMWWCHNHSINILLYFHCCQCHTSNWHSSTYYVTNHDTMTLYDIVMYKL